MPGMKAGVSLLTVYGVLLSVSLAGCLGEDPLAGVDCGRVHVRATDPVVLAPPDERTYDGTDVTRANGTLEVRTNDADNTGDVLVDLSMPNGDRYAVRWTRFHALSGQAYQDGGIASNVVEHGASGQGHRMEPQFDLCSGGWGTTEEATLNGGPIVDPVTGSTTLFAHYMLTKSAMLEEDTYRVYKSDRQTPFDPWTAEDGHVFPDRPEGHFATWSEGAYKDGYAVPDPRPVTTTHNDIATGIDYQETYEIPVTAVMSEVTVEVRITGGAGQFDVALKDPEGKVLDAGRATVAEPATLSASGPLVLGTHGLVVTGFGAQAAYSATVTVDPPAPFLLHVVYVDVDLNPR